MLKGLTVAILGFITCFGAISAQENPKEQEQVEQRLHEFTDTLNKGNANAISSFWTDNPEIVTPVTGEIIEGKPAVDQYIQNKIKKLNGKQISFDPKTIDFPNDNSSIVEGVVQLYDNGKLVDRQARRVELNKVNGQWYVDFLSEIPVELPPSAYEHLKELEWLLGSWRDEDPNVSIQFNGKWDKFKNFLTQTFSMEIYGLETLEGLQIIGWDPIEKKIRAWVYDSDGGFGSGIWSKIDNGWSAKFNYTLSSGETAASTNLYTDIQDKSYSYSSIDRKVGNVQLPNIESVTVLKE